MNEREFQAVVLGALLHDIGKFWHRTGELPGTDHPELSNRFITNYLDPEWVDAADIAARHHLRDVKTARNPALTMIVTLADWLSSGERISLEEGEEGTPSALALISVFSTLYHSEEYTRFPLSELPEDGKIEPSASYEPGWADYQRLWHCFTQEAGSLKGLGFDALVNRLLALLEKYTMFIPAAAYRSLADISLFHHLKLSAAIAACIYRTGLEPGEVEGLIEALKSEQVSGTGEVAALVGGDLSGIQEFIYNLRAEGALKSLRGRSLYLQLVSEAVAGRILDLFQLPRTNLLYCGGGHFYLLVPVVDNLAEKIAGVAREVDQVLLAVHQGRLSVTVAVERVRAEEFRLERFGRVWEGLHRQLAEMKRRRFHRLIESGEWQKVLGPVGVGGEAPGCAICGEELTRGEQEVCSLCDSFIQLGRQLHQAKYLIEKPVAAHPLDRRDWNAVLAALGRSYSFVTDIRSGTEEQVSILNSTELPAGDGGFRFIATHVPQAEGKTAELKDIAGKADGVKRWGVLRMDVDRLGETFRKGLGETASVSRLAMLSYLLSYFFSARVQALAQEDKFRDSIYLAYSGGDDLFVIGAWSQLPQFARRIYEEFQRFTSGRLTLSAGIFVAPAEKFPVYEAAQRAGDAEDQAKMMGRNALVFLDAFVSWNDYPDVRDITCQLVELLGDGYQVPRALLSILNSSWVLERQSAQGEVPVFPVWRLLYALTRLKARMKNMPEAVLKLDELEKLVVQGINLHPHLPLITRWAELRTRA
ncbi:MAG: type III-A CRISPR-associated protein Cas10/Csm1 [candidate division WOR-3 bacterium]